MSDLDPVEQNIRGVNQLVGSKLNKISGGVINNQEGVSDGEFEDQFTLKLSDEELLALSRQWTIKYAGYESKIKLRQEANKTYYLGRQKDGSSTAIVEGQPVSDNLLFEAEETFLPAALSKNPEPVVWCDNSAEGTQLASDLKTMLQFHADQLVLRRKLTLMTRHWSIYFLGILKHGWDEKIADIKTEVRDPRNFIFDPEGFIDCYGDYEGPLGERISLTADKLIELFPQHRAYITINVDGKLGTEVTYTEWWSDEYTFCTFKDKVLDKNKNPYFNPETESTEVDLDGMEHKVKKPGKNHFGRAKKPYTFLSVFSFGEQPHDVTSLIEQNIPNQRRITRRADQLDYNLSRANNSDVFSKDNFTEETAKLAANAMTKGNPILVPSGKPISEAIHRLQAPTVGAEFFRELEQSKEDLRSIFGTQGITAQPPQEDATARGMILSQQYDNTRIGGGIGDALEQVADNVFNWWVQLYYVFYDEPHYAAVMGQMKAVEFITLSSADLDRRFIISVAPDSMKPHDEITEMNQAMTLWENEALDIKTLLTMLNFPDPQNTAAQVMLYKTNPQLYMQLNFPELAQQIAALQQPQNAASGPPSAEGGQGGGSQAQNGAVPPTPPPTTGGVQASPSLSQIPINSQNLPK